MNRLAVLPALLLLLASAAPAGEFRLRLAADACPVEAADRWGWRVEVLREAPGQWLVRARGHEPSLPDPEGLRPLAEAVRAVKARLAYAPDVWTEDPEEALRAGRGNCVSFTAVLERDLRRLGFVTRTVHGLLFDADGGANPFYLPSLRATPHRWAEVLTPDYGWVPVDPVAPAGRLTGRHLALRGGGAVDWARKMSAEVLRWD